MPYILHQDRFPLRPIASKDARFSGELNYQFTCVLQDYIGANGLSYQTINDIVGALEGAKAEFQRRVVAPYEDAKKTINGDIY